MYIYYIHILITYYHIICTYVLFNSEVENWSFQLFRKHKGLHIPQKQNSTFVFPRLIFIAIL